MRNIVKKEAERDEILAVLEEADGSILNLEKYVGYGILNASEEEVYRHEFFGRENPERRHRKAR